MNLVEKEVKRIIKRCGTPNPFLIAKYLQISILYHDLPINIKGYSSKYRRMKCIVLNEELSEAESFAVLCHELGHNVMHQETNTVFFENFSSTSVVSKIEHEANCFMFLLLKENIEFESITSKTDFINSIGMPDDMIRYIDLLW